MNKIILSKLRFSIFLFVFLQISCKSDSSDTWHLNDQQLTNVKVFSSIYGVSRFFNPSSENKSINWDNFAIFGVREVTKAKNNDELIDILKGLFYPINPAIQIFPLDDYEAFQKESITPSNQDEFKMYYWRHYGLGAKEQKSYNIYESRILEKELNDFSDSIRIGDFFEDTLVSQIVFRVPLALYGSNDKTFPEPDKGKFIEITRKLGIDFSEQFTIDDKSFLIGNIVNIWNILKYFYPYFDEIPEVKNGSISKAKYWENVLVESMIAIRTCKTEFEYEEILSKLIASLDDGHGRLVTGHVIDNVCYPPFVTDWVEDKLVVSKLLDTNITGIKLGDVIDSIDGESSISKITFKEKFISAATDNYRRIRCLDEELFKGKCLSKVNISVLSKHIEISRKLGAIDYYESGLDSRRFVTIDEIQTGIYYVNLLNITSIDLKNNLTKLSAAKGIIFDVRGYPKEDVTFILQHLTNDTLKSNKFLVPVLTRPNSTRLDTAKGWILPPMEPKIYCRVIFLTDAHAISYAESFMGIVENYKLGLIFGENTAGTNGNVNNYVLPGSYNIMWTGMKVIKNDDSNLHGVGIIPTMKISKTIKSLKNGEDAVYLEALKFLKN